MEAKNSREAELRSAVEKVELIDAHAHNLVDSDSSIPFLRCFTEADGDALSLAPHTLSFKRSLRDIAGLYGCPASFGDVEEYREAAGLEACASACFKASGISAVFIDDGIVMDKMHPLEWHRSYAPVVCRILRIERLAEEILEEERPKGSTWTLDLFTDKFKTKLNSLADKVVALKSIAAYRSGLDINTNVRKEDAEKGLIEDTKAGTPVRIRNKSLIDYIFVCSLEVALLFDLPLQIHTGFGDKDLDLRLSNPLHLRAVLEDSRFSKCRFVILHASYPFSKEASYLASVYSQVHLDFGLAIPKLSMHGMVSCIKELLHLSPLKKVMFSTDGYAFPETYYLGAKRSRDAIFSVLSEALDEGDLTLAEAKEAVEDIFKNNALKFYKINEKVGSISPDKPFSSISKPKENTIVSKSTVFVRVLWVDTSGQHRCRVVPGKRFYDIIVRNGLSLTFGCMGMTSSRDAPVDETNLTGTGEIRLMPDLSTLKRIPWSQQEEMVLADMHLKPGEAWDYCPRQALRKATKVLKDEFNLEVNAGFENEFYLLKNVQSEGKSSWVPYDLGSYCSTSGFDAASTIFQEIYLGLQSVGVVVEQVHAESGKGQFEVVLGHTVCGHAADIVIYAREVIKAVARKHGLLATFVPKCFLDDAGSGSHVHLSLSENGHNVFMASPESKTQYGMTKVAQEFMAGVLTHLPAIMAFTAPLPNSYDRIQPNSCTGAYLCWGNENKEAPLRTACPPGVENGLVSNFEIKCFDGCANPYLGLTSIIAAGIDGLRKKLTLPKPLEKNPASCGGGELKRLPLTLNESVAALSSDELFKEIIGEKLLAAVIGVRKYEIEFYSKDKEAYKQLIHRY